MSPSWVPLMKRPAARVDLPAFLRAPLSWILARAGPTSRSMERTLATAHSGRSVTLGQGPVDHARERSRHVTRGGEVSARRRAGDFLRRWPRRYGGSGSRGRDPYSGWRLT